MIAFIGVFSFFGLLVCINRFIKKKPRKPVAISIAVCFMIFIVCLAIDLSNENKQQADYKDLIKPEQISTLTGGETFALKAEKSNNTIVEKSSQHEEFSDPINYDKLQNVFLAFNFEITEDDLIKLIEDSHLEYTIQKYNGSPKKFCYKIAYEHDVALQKRGKSGDYIDISFSLSDRSFMYAEYFNHKSFKTALLYNYGTYWDLRETEENNQYSGFYYYKPGDGEGGITIEHSNGNSNKTGYHYVNTGEEALWGVLN